jgi:acetyltransferase-like isoleucine patch superfamily enzyme
MKLIRLFKLLRRLSSWDDDQWDQLEKLLKAPKAEEKVKEPERLCRAQGVVFYPESRISNLADDASKITVGQGGHIRGELLVFRFGGTLAMGRHCYLGENSRIWAGEQVRIGDNVLISHDVFITDCNAHELDPDERAAGFRRIVELGHPSEQGNVMTAPVNIEDNVWINPQSVILPGVTIGRGAVIGCGSVVTKSIPPMVFAAGNPAQVIRSLV